MVKQYAVTILEMGETILVSARSPQDAYDRVEVESRAMFTPAPNFDQLSIGVKEAKTPLIQDPIRTAPWYPAALAALKARKL